jgi:hypothetical protein
MWGNDAARHLDGTRRRALKKKEQDTAAAHVISAHPPVRIEKRKFERSLVEGARAIQIVNV